MDFRQFLCDNYVYLDGGLGSLLQKRGLAPGQKPETFNILHPEIVVDIHKGYYDAGSNVVNANTFGANIFNYPDEDELRSVIEAAIKNVREAAALSEKGGSDQPKFVSLDIGSLGQLLKPYGQLEFEEAVRAFAKTVRIGAAAGADIVSIETMNDCLETKAALLAVKENCDLPVLVTDAFDEKGKLMTGADPAAMTAMLEAMGADAVGTNCSVGPRQLRGVMKEFLRCASIPVVFKPNAGLPRVENGETVFDVTADEFAEEVIMQMKAGIRVVGGCCGTTPEYIRKVTSLAAAEGLKTPPPITDKELCVVSSYTHAVYFDKDPILIGERINPTGKKRFRQALVEHDIDYILNEGIRQADEGVHVLDVNVGIPDIDEPALLTEVVRELQAVTDLPLQLDTSDPSAMEASLRAYNGKAMINSVNGKEEVMHAIFPPVKKYGGYVVALTIDEGGIPETVEGRINIAKKIIATAKEYGIGRKDLIFDPLCMTISADTRAALTTLECVRILTDELGVRTSLGISNVSFGLPKRSMITAGMFAAALERGLSAAIMNPFAPEMMTTYHSFRAIHNLDENCSDFIEFADGYDEKYAPAAVSVQNRPAESKKENADMTELMSAIVKGLKEQSAKITGKLIDEGGKPLDIVQQEVIPALNVVGEGFEAGRIYLPQLLMSAEAAKEAFVIIKAALETERDTAPASGKSCRIVIATVKGDVHDIGKNIVKLLLENYGFDVTDLGKDVDPEDVLDAVIKLQAQVCGLSALMTTTVPAMEETIKLIHDKAPWCRVMVGGAVLTQEYADKIGADAYSKDAMGSVRYVESLM